ncbi:MAG: elongation factor G, partial [Pseudomonadota bacterium]
MATHTSEGIRNIVLAGHAGTGKTTLAEALLAATGTIRQAGTLERGSTVCDFDPMEHEHGHSLDVALCHMTHRDRHINLLDTPGYPDFVPRAISVLPAAETVAVVVNARHGVEPGTHRMMQAAKDCGLCRMVIINHIDDPEADNRAVIRQVRSIFGNECLPMNLPAGGGTGVVDCFFEPGEEQPDFASVDVAHTEMVDQVVEVDEALMELYLEQGEELSIRQLHDPFEKALREGHLVPICFTSATTGAGIPELLDVIARLMPNPMEGNPPPFLKGEGEDATPVEVKPDADDHVIAHVFKVTVDPFVGKMGIFRVHQGTVTPNSQLFIGDGRKPFKATHLYQLQGKEHAEVPKAVPGDICAVTKVDEIHYDAVLHDSHDEDHFHLAPAPMQPPMQGIAIHPTRRGDEQKLSDALHKVCAEDPSLVLEHNATANETVLRGIGELHLRAVLEKMKDRFNVEVETTTPSIAYRETVTKPAEGHHRHKKQTGGAGQFGEVHLRIEPLPRGEGFEFVDKVVGGVIPSQFIPAVEKGVRQVLDHGAVGGFPMQDIRVTVHDGKHHPVDSKEVAFAAAGRKAFLDAIEKARPIILEPIASLAITVPGNAVGDVTGDLSSRRGRISGSTVLARLAIGSRMMG